MESGNSRNMALKVTGICLLAGALWLLLWDAVAEPALAGCRTTAEFAGKLKGWLHAGFSGLVIYVITNMTFKNRQKAVDDLVKTNAELSKAKDQIASAYGQLASSEGQLKKKYDECLAAQKKLLDLKARLHEMAYYDQLTGIPNRVSYSVKVEELQEEKDKFALLYMDLDNFKYVNDTLGHTFGDRLLKKVCDIMKGLLDENSSIYRISGDKFAILIENFNELREIEKTAVKLLKWTKNPMEIDGKIFYNTASIGVAIYPDHGRTADELLKSADIAVFKAKETGRNRIVIYSESMNAVVNEWAHIEKYLRSALENSEFELYYQPQYNAGDMKISGFEALIRWRNDEIGLIMPDKFIRVSEDTHLIIPIGEWVLRNACILLKHLERKGYGGIGVSVNVSRLQLLQDDFVDFVVDAIEMADVEPGGLEIDIAETVFVESYDIIADKIKLLEKYGVRIALDEFGKKYSSMNYLRRLPVNTLKIDKSFVDVISSSDEGRILADFIVKAGRAMNMSIVAVGVETREQFECLSALNCDRVQGYFFCRPLPERDVLEKLKKQYENGS